MVVEVVSVSVVVIVIVIAMIVVSTRRRIKQQAKPVQQAAKRESMERHPAGKKLIPHQWDEPTQTWTCLNCGEQRHPDPCDCPCHIVVESEQ